MVGHTGVFEAAGKAVEAVDACAGKVIGAVLAKGGAVLLTADHGNADKMYDPYPEHPFTCLLYTSIRRGDFCFSAPLVPFRPNTRIKPSKNRQKCTL